MALGAIIWDLTTQALCLYATASAQKVADQMCGSSLAEAASPLSPHHHRGWRFILLLQLETLDTSPTMGTRPTDQAQKKLLGIATPPAVVETAQHAESELWRTSPAQLFAGVIYHDRALAWLSCPFVGDQGSCTWRECTNAASFLFLVKKQDVTKLLHKSLW